MQAHRETPGTVYDLDLTDIRNESMETIEVNPIIFRKLTREDWLHIVNVCNKSLEKYYLRLKK